MNYQHIDLFIKDFGPEAVIDSLSPLLTESRKNRIQAMLKNRIQSVHVAVESPYDVHNALAIVRSAEAFGINHIHIIDQMLKRNKGRGTMQGASRWTHLGIYPQLTDFLNRSNHQDFTLAAACVDGKIPLEEVPVDKPICLLFGNELLGLSSQAVEASTITYKIPMFGMVESLNLSVSAAISLHDIAKRRRQFLGADTDLTASDYLNEHAWAYVRAIGFERSKSVLARVQKLA